VEATSRPCAKTEDDAPVRVASAGAKPTTETDVTDSKRFVGGVCCSCKEESNTSNIDIVGTLVVLVIRLSPGLGDGRRRTS
jgi:hypothetical protein